jgi:tetratricopeptide (TPR) repeat protein
MQNNGMPHICIFILYSIRRTIMSQSIFFKLYLFFTLVFIFISIPFASSEKELLTDGKRLFWSGDYKQALKKIEEVLSINPVNVEAHYFRGYLFQRDNSGYQRDNPGIQIPEITWEFTDRISKEFEKVIRLEPEYAGEIIILPPREKIMSEWSALAEAYLNAGNIEKAKAAFEEGKKRGGLVPELYGFMKNMLLSCPPDAVLITAGDMDTFFPLYFQVVEGLRNDVTILNIYLCQTPWFLKMITKNLPWQRNVLKLSFPDKELKNIDKLTVGYNKPFNVFIQKPGCSNQSDGITLNITPLAQNDGKPHIKLNDLVYINVVKENAERPLCIAPTVKDRTLNYRIYVDGKLFDPFQHLEKHGLVEVLTLCPNDNAAQIDANETMLTKIFSYGDIPNSEKTNAYDHLVNYYITAFVHTAVLMEKQGMRDRSRALFQKLVDLIPGIRFLKDEKQRDYIMGLAGKPISK